jgi:hypothetical protein
MSMDSSVKKNRVIDWIDYRLPVFTFLRHELDEHPTPKTLNYEAQGRPDDEDCDYA